MTWISVLGAQGACQKGLRASGLKGLQPIYNSILFYFILIGQRLEDIAGAQAAPQLVADSITKLEFQRYFQQWEMRKTTVSTQKGTTLRGTILACN